MPALNSTFLILIAVIVLAVALGGVIAFLYVRARRAEEAGGATSAAPVSQKEVLRQKEEQVTKIRQRIEELYQQQQQEQRIQHAQLSQQMDDVKLHIETNDRKVDGLRSELHHEIERRNQELDELRHQLAGALDSFWKTHDALPEGQSAGPRMLTAGSAPQAAAPAEPAPITPIADSAPAAPEPADATFVDTTPVAEPEAPASSGLEWQSFDFAADVSSADVTGAEVTPEDPTPVDAASFDGPSGDSSTPDAPLPTFASFASLTSTPPPAAPATPAPSPSASEPAAPVPSVSVPSAPAPPEPAPSVPAASVPAPEPQAPARPDGADDLTVISGIDEDVQQQLYALDVIKLDQVARWSRTEARRVAQELGLRPQVVMDQWVFEAQSVLFDQYQQQLA
ncbi:MAG: hypothetical protein AAGG50_11655 [Bacteroidota bacterium]